MCINIKQILGMTALLTTMSSSPANAGQSLPVSTPNLSVLQAGHYKGKIRKVYKSIQDGDILKAKAYMKEIPSKDYQDLFPVYELARYYLNTFDSHTVPNAATVWNGYIPSTTRITWHSTRLYTPERTSLLPMVHLTVSKVNGFHRT